MAFSLAQFASAECAGVPRAYSSFSSDDTAWASYQEEWYTNFYRHVTQDVLRDECLVASAVSLRFASGGCGPQLPIYGRLSRCAPTI